MSTESRGSLPGTGRAAGGGDGLPLAPAAGPLGDARKDLVGGLDPGLGGLADPNDVAVPDELGGLRVETYVVRLAGRRCDRREQLARQLVVQTPAANDAFEGRGEPRRLEDSVARRITRHDAVKPLDDVIPKPELRQVLPPGGRELPCSMPAGRRHSEARQRRQARQDRSPELAPERSDALRPYPGVRVREALDDAVERSESLLLDLALALAGDVGRGPQAQLARDELLRARAHVLLDVARRDSELLAVGVDPDEAAAQVHFHLLDELPGEGPEVDLARVLGRDDEAELALFPSEGLRRRRLVDNAAGVVHDARRAVSLDAVSLDVVQVARGGQTAAPRH